MCSESQDTPGRKLEVVVSAGDVSTTRSKFLECGGSARRSNSALGSKTQMRTEYALGTEPAMPIKPS